MPCFHPLEAFRLASGEVVFHARTGMDVVKELRLPCGQCVGCRLERSRQWAVRCMHEAKMWPANCFVTLTYRDADLPDNGNLVYDDFQRFMKRLRKGYQGVGTDEKGDRPIRFYMAGEYGSKFGRPHFHACIFNFEFEDKRVYMRTPGGSMLYRSEKLERLWPHGFSSIGDVNFQSAAYVARYIMKKVTGNDAETHYSSVDKDTGEYTQKIPEFNRMSLKPGIGARWFEKYHEDVYPNDVVIVNGRRAKPPKYYDKLLRKVEPEEYEYVLHNREVAAIQRSDGETRQRLLAKETVMKAKIEKLKRVLT